jgi:protein involved in polysaccharide export with SLBB domain
MKTMVLCAKNQQNSRGLLKARPSQALALVGMTLMLTGCTALTRPIDGVPAKRLPPQFFEGDRSNLIPIDISLLSQEEPRDYPLAAGDVLGVMVDQILPFSKPDEVPQLPPVHFPEPQSTLPPSTGFPLTILEDGTISLPLLKPIEIEGLTVDQARDKIRQSYIDAEILKEEQEVSVVVTLIRKRQVVVTVVRQDLAGVLGGGGGGMGGQFAAMQLGNRPTGTLGVDYGASGRVLKLDAYENDILHALMETGGLPGVSAKNEVKVIRNNSKDKQARLQFMKQYSDMVAQYANDPCNCPPPMPDDPTVVRIPLRFKPGQMPSISPEDAILEEGDVVLIETRDTEFFFTGGLLPGGQTPLPRDYDLDAIGAMALVGYSLDRTNQQQGLLGAVGFSQVVPPGRLYILRPSSCGKDQIAIEVDLAKALNDPRQRPIIRAGDALILQYKPCEEAINFGVGTFFTFGIQRLFNNR